MLTLEYINLNQRPKIFIHKSQKNSPSSVNDEFKPIYYQIQDIH